MKMRDFIYAAEDLTVTVGKFITMNEEELVKKECNWDNLDALVRTQKAVKDKLEMIKEFFNLK